MGTLVMIAIWAVVIYAVIFVAAMIFAGMRLLFSVPVTPGNEALRKIHEERAAMRAAKKAAKRSSK